MDDNELAIWDRFLDTHPLTMQEETAFLDYVTQPGAAPMRSLADLEQAWEAFQRAQEDEGTDEQ